MRKTCPKKLQFLSHCLPSELGFTLIELLITFTLITILFSIGVSQYNKFNRRQILVKAKDQLLSDLRLAQNKSLVAEKPQECGDNPLSGYKLKFSDNQNYKIVAICVDEVDVKSDLSLPNNIIKSSGPDEIFFKVLSQGVDSDTIFTLSGFGETQTIMVSKVGEIK